MKNKKCPHCEKELKLPEHAFYNSLNYNHQNLLVKTECCGKGIVLKHKIMFFADRYIGSRDTDDFNQKIK
jgi:hypothetical protein